MHQQLAPESHLQVHTAAEVLLQMVAVRQTHISQLLWSAQPLPQQLRKGTPESRIRRLHDKTHTCTGICKQRRCMRRKRCMQESLTCRSLAAAARSQARRSFSRCLVIATSSCMQSWRFKLHCILVNISPGKCMALRRFITSYKNTVCLFSSSSMVWPVACMYNNSLAGCEHISWLPRWHLVPQPSLEHPVAIQGPPLHLLGSSLIAAVDPFPMQTGELWHSSPQLPLPALHQRNAYHCSDVHSICRLHQ